MGDWIFEENGRKSTHEEESEQKEINESITPCAVQKNWKTPSEFPLCPTEISETSLDQYLHNLKKGEVLARNKNGKFIVHLAGYSVNSKAILVVCNNFSGVKKWSLARISIEDQHFVHESIQTFFALEGAQKQFTLGRGLEWEGGDSIDDYS